MQEKQFNQQILKYTPFLEAFALKLTSDTEKANDLFQETVCRAITYRDKFHSGNLKAWLATIMRNLFINSMREKKLGDSTIMMKELKSEIDLLHPDLKKPFIMKYEGFKYQEIADEMDAPLGTIKSRIHIARKQLMRKLSYLYGTTQITELAA